MAERPMVSASALSAFQTWMPGDLSEEHLDRVMTAVNAVAEQAWRDGAAAQYVVNDIRREVRGRTLEQRHVDQKAEAFDAGWEAHRQEALAAEKDPEHAIHRRNPWRTEPGVDRG